jgi:ketosteroid isomerase-like protein
MSQENVEVVRGVIEAYNAGDWPRYFSRLDPGIEWWDREDDPGATVHRGHEGVRAFLAELGEAAELRVDAKEFVDAGDYVVVCLRLYGRGKGSGAGFEEHEVHALRLRNGKVVETREYRTKAQALEAVGLSE